MQQPSNDARLSATKVPWNKGKMIGAKPPLQAKHIWAVRTKLQMDGRIHDLAMFNLAIDSKLRGCDVVRLKVEDVAPRGVTADSACVPQRKTGHPVKFELTEQTREAVDAYIKAKHKHFGDYLFESRGRPNRSMSTGSIRAWSPLDQRDWLGSAAIRNAFAASHQSHADLSTNRESARGPAFVGPHQD